MILKFPIKSDRIYPENVGGLMRGLDEGVVSYDIGEIIGQKGVTAEEVTKIYLDRGISIAVEKVEELLENLHDSNKVVRIGSGQEQRYFLVK